MRPRLLTSCLPSPSDAQLARRAGAGDDEAFETLYARYQPRLEAYCRSIVRHDEDARDAVQNAMTKALVALRRAEATTNVQGWLFRIAHNEAITLLRRRRPTTELQEVVHDRRPGPAAELMVREELRATLDGVRALPGHLQHPLLLRELAGLSYDQVAEVVGGTPAGARKAVFDARAALSADRAGRDEACSAIRLSLSEGDGRRRRARIVRHHLRSCHACCAWDDDQRLRVHHFAALPAAAAAGSAGGWFAGLFGGGTTVTAGASGGLAAQAKIAASLAVIAAGATPVVSQVERKPPARAVHAAGARAPRAAPPARSSAPSPASAVRSAAVPATTAAAPTGSARPASRAPVATPDAGRTAPRRDEPGERSRDRPGARARERRTGERRSRAPDAAHRDAAWGGSGPHSEAGADVRSDHDRNRDFGGRAGAPAATAAPAEDRPPRAATQARHDPRGRTGGGELAASASAADLAHAG